MLRSAALELATSFRSAVEAVVQTGNAPMHIQGFPRGCCGIISELMGDYLNTLGLGEFVYVCGMKDGALHAWLEVDRLIVDITGDQFPDRLGIAARIKDGSLICIDEPEICLHPEWQERYIQLLMSTFQGFNSCQFIVATHSPQIVSRLGSENCYVLDLQNNSLQPAKVFNNRSVDFQLAQVFNAPGFKNEYMMRELLSIVGTLSSGQDLSRKQTDFIGGAKALKSAFSSDDPVLRLINMVVEALKVKGAQGV